MKKSGTPVIRRTVKPLSLVEIMKGLLLTTRHFIFNFFGKKYTVTRQYPEHKMAYPDAFRGEHRLMRRPDGELRCVACMLCATACPANCIYIEAEEVDDPMVEKRAKVFVIDELRCVHCGLCVEACPTDAIRMDSGKHVAPEYNRKNFIYDLSRLKKNGSESSAIQGGDPNFKPKGR